MTHFRLALALFLLAMCLRAAWSAEPLPDFAARRQAYLENYIKRLLPVDANPNTWVDSERWCVAHACLEANTRLEEANRYFSTVQFAALWHGLVADSDVQVTDLLWTYLRFRDTDRLTPAARAHLRQLFTDWQPPNPDRNRLADQEYAWPAAYTENHSLNILAAAYLIDVVLERDRAKHTELLLAFLADRARWGWSEFYSPSYGIVTAKVLGLLAATAPDTPVADTARMLLDLLVLDFANGGLVCWRGMPYARGYGAEVDNTRNSYYEVARLWFGDPTQTAFNGSPFMLHLLTDGYRPPDAAMRLLANMPARGRYEIAQTVTHGPGKLRVPLVCWVSSAVTIASAQGSGSYYDGCYASISFAANPHTVIVARDGKQRTMFQHRNVLMTYGQVNWHGPLKKTVTGGVTVGGDERAWVGQLDLPASCHLLLAAEKADYADATAFRAALTALDAKWENGLVTWTAPDGAKVAVTTVPDGARWRFTGAAVNGQPVRLDRNMLYNTPTMRSVRDSGVVEIQDDDRLLVYDFRDRRQPHIRAVANGKLTPVPPDRLDGPLGIRLCYIPPGEFAMGSPLTEGRDNERPQRWVTLNGFYIGETEITVGQYQAYLAANPTAARLPDWYARDWGKTDRHPITWVSWEDAAAFCRWVSAQSGRTVRLPTEAEWEKAATGFTHQAYPWGDAYDGTQSGTPNGTYAPAGEHPLDVSPFGVRGMAGNAWEWCSDWYTPNATRPLRGCGWNFDPDTFRCAYRTCLPPGERSLHIGFRVVVEM